MVVVVGKARHVKKATCTECEGGCRWHLKEHDLFQNEMLDGSKRTDG